MTEENKNKSWLQRFKSKVEAWQSIVVGIASIGALVFAFLSNQTANENLDKITTIENFYQLSDSIAASFEVAYFDSYLDTGILKGKFQLGGNYTCKSSLFKEGKLCVFINQGFFFYPMIGNVVVGSDSKWFHNNVNIGIDGDFTMIIALTTTGTNDMLTRWNNSQFGKAFNGLPDGFHIISSFRFTKLGDNIERIDKKQF
jgi:hypothetical protein